MHQPDDLALRRRWLLITVAVPIMAVVVCTVAIPTVQTGSRMNEASMGDIIMSLALAALWVALTAALAWFWWRTEYRPQTLRSAVFVMAIGLSSGALAFLPYEFLLADLGARAFEPTLPLLATSLGASTAAGLASLARRAST